MHLGFTGWYSCEIWYITYIDSFKNKGHVLRAVRCYTEASGTGANISGSFPTSVLGLNLGHLRDLPQLYPLRFWHTYMHTISLELRSDRFFNFFLAFMSKAERVQWKCDTYGKWTAQTAQSKSKAHDTCSETRISFPYFPVDVRKVLTCVFFLPGWTLVIVAFSSLMLSLTSR